MCEYLLMSAMVLLALSIWLNFSQDKCVSKLADKINKIYEQTGMSND